MKKTILDRSIFTVVACIALAVCLLVPSVRVTRVELAPEMEELVGAERAEAFSRCLEELQTWYHGKTVTTEGVTVTQEDYDQLEAILMDCLTYLDRDLGLEALSDELQETYEWADANLAYLMYSVVIPLMEILSQQESYTCEQSVWTSIGSAMDQLIEMYQAAV